MARHSWWWWWWWSNLRHSPPPPPPRCCCCCCRCRGLAVGYRRPRAPVLPFQRRGGGGEGKEGRRGEEVPVLLLLLPAASPLFFFAGAKKAPQPAHARPRHLLPPNRRNSTKLPERQTHRCATVEGVGGHPHLMGHEMTGHTTKTTTCLFSIISSCRPCPCRPCPWPSA